MIMEDCSKFERSIGGANSNGSSMSVERLEFPKNYTLFTGVALFGNWRNEQTNSIIDLSAVREFRTPRSIALLPGPSSSRRARRARDQPLNASDDPGEAPSRRRKR